LEFPTKIFVVCDFADFIISTVQRSAFLSFSAKEGIFHLIFKLEFLKRHISDQQELKTTHKAGLIFFTSIPDFSVNIWKINGLNH
jgi:hypothetical protein